MWLPYVGQDWYWKTDDGKVYSSKANALVAEDDETYTEWIADGGMTTRWPVDDAGDQTVPALQWVLTPYGITVPSNILG